MREQSAFDGAVSIRVPAWCSGSVEIDVMIAICQAAATDVGIAGDGES